MTTSSKMVSERVEHAYKPKGFIEFSRSGGLVPVWSNIVPIYSLIYVSELRDYSRDAGGYVGYMIVVATQSRTFLVKFTFPHNSDRKPPAKIMQELKKRGNALIANVRDEISTCAGHGKGYVISPRGETLPVAAIQALDTVSTTWHNASFHVWLSPTLEIEFEYLAADYPKPAYQNEAEKMHSRVLQAIRAHALNQRPRR